MRGLHEPLMTSTALQPAPHAGAVGAIDLAEYALEIGFLPRDHAVADDEGEGHERHQRPEAVEGDGETGEPQHHAEVNGIAREAVRARCRRLIWWACWWARSSRAE